MVIWFTIITVAGNYNWFTDIVVNLWYRVLLKSEDHGCQSAPLILNW